VIAFLKEYPVPAAMSRTRSIPLCIALLTSGLCYCFGATEPSPWLEIHSTHFTVITDAGENRGREVALRFEQMRAVFATLLSKERLHQSVPLTILAFSNDKSYFQVAPLHQGQPIDVPGFFLAGEDQDFIVLNLAEPEPWRAVAHDLAAMLVSYNYPPAQEWFDDGLADYFSSIRIDNKQYSIGAAPYSQQFAGSKTPSFTSLLSTQPWLPLHELFATKHDLGTLSMYEAESWIVMNYLIHEKKLSDTGTYLGLVLMQHASAEDAIQQAFGMSSAQLSQLIQDYFHSHSAQFAEAANAPAAASSGVIERANNLVAPDDSTITSKRIPESDERALYAGIQIRIPERRDAGLKTLHDLATTPTETDKKSEAKQTKRMGEDPDQLPSNAIGNATAHRLLAWDLIQRGEFEESFVEIGDAGALNRSDMWVRYYLCSAKYKMAQAKHTDILGLANMLIDLRTVLEWYPEMAGAYDLLALARNAGGTTTAAMQAERAALMLSPRNELYSYHLAQIYVDSKQWDAANALVDRLKASSNPEIAALAKDLSTKAGAERKYGINLNSPGNAPTKFEAQKTPFDVLDEDAAKREAADKNPSGTADKRVTRFVRGRLLAIDCSKSPQAILTVSSDAGTLKLRAADFRALLLIGADDFSCDWRDRQVTVNYKPAGGNDGDLVSLEMR